MFRLRITGDLGFEFWQDIPGWEGLYQVSTYGNVRSLDRIQPFKNRWGYICDRRMKGQDIKPRMDRNGYSIVYLKDKEKNKLVKIHRLVGIAFIPKWKTEYDQINHKNEIKTDNKVENLEWCDCTYNINYGSRTEKATKLLRKEVLQFDLNGKYLATYPSLVEAAKQTHISTGSISYCCNGIRKAANGYIWKYKKDA